MYRSSIIQSFLHTDEANLKKLINKNWTVLDLGCGDNPPLLRVMQPSSYLGIDAYEKSINEANQNAIAEGWSDCIFQVKDLLTLNFAEGQFDAVLCIDVIEHLRKEDGERLLENAKRWTDKILYVSTPNGFLRQDPYDSNLFQEHLSGWTVEEFEALGFLSVKGGGGLKILRKTEMQPDQWSHVSGSSLRWKPRLFWVALSAVTQMLFFHWPKWSYQVHAVYEKKALN
jgi:2-polyprenyl-3-methyl-5-hydroxy-6-metoxy-1,4-benzoquinol methylase